MINRSWSSDEQAIKARAERQNNFNQRTNIERYKTCTMASTTDSSTTNCAACGKEGGNLNTCNKCKMVTYCNAACKKKHRSKHKKACERRVAELHVYEELFKEHPPRDDCPICFLPLPFGERQATFSPCCGKVICTGCIVAMDEEARGRGKVDICAFCRVTYPRSAAENIKRMQKLMEADNANAFYRMAGIYGNGYHGIPQDYRKAIELWLRAGELGCTAAYLNLGICYYNGWGVEVDKKKAIHYWELGAMNGDVYARHYLGCEELEAGNYHQAYKHIILSANTGFKPSLDEVMRGFMAGHVTKDEYEKTLRAYHQRCNEMKSEDRNKVRARISEGVLARISEGMLRL